MPEKTVSLTLIEISMAAVQDCIASRTLTPSARLPAIWEFVFNLKSIEINNGEANERLKTKGIIQL